MRPARFRIVAKIARELARNRYDTGEIGVGIGIDSGDTNFGELGRSHRDLTAVGTVVNRAACAQTAALPGQILVTDAVRTRAEPLVTGAGRGYELKGFGAPVMLFPA